MYLIKKIQGGLLINSIVTESHVEAKTTYCAWRDANKAALLITQDSYTVKILEGLIIVNTLVWTDISSKMDDRIELR